MTVDTRDDEERERSKAELRPVAVDLLRDLRGGGLPNPMAALEQLAFLLLALYAEREAPRAGKPCTVWSDLMVADSAARLSVLREIPGRIPGSVMEMSTLLGLVPMFPSASLLSVVALRLEALRPRPYLCADLFDACLSEVSVTSIVGSPRTPAAVNECLLGLTQPKGNERVLDPAAGAGDRLLAVLRRAARTGEHPDVRGLDSDVAMVRLGLFSLTFHGVRQPNLTVGNALERRTNLHEPFDVVLCQPPFGMRIDPTMVEAELRELPNARSEVLFAEYVLRVLSDGGRAVIVLPANVAFSPASATRLLRHRLVDAGLRAVVTLPGGTFQPHTNVETFIVALGPSDNDMVVFIDARANPSPDAALGEDLLRRTGPIVDGLHRGYIDTDELRRLAGDRCFTVTHDAIRENDCSLMPSTYRPETAKTLVTESPLALLREITETETRIGVQLATLRQRLGEQQSRPRD